MPADIVIRAQGLGKLYSIARSAERSRYVALRDVLAEAASGLWRRAVGRAKGQRVDSGHRLEDFWALRQVEFEVARGEVLGIIGRNGAGKSTLLKILSRITEPTEGRIEIEGRVASLLEVGTGFHPELTGRENVYLNGAILGMSRTEVRRKFDEIVAFAEVDRFLDTPVKRYSSGMYVRLAFAVAAHLEPEILIVDEVLAVGDAEFQKKCLGKMDAVADSGRTVLFVSHNLQAAAALCTRGILLANGKVVANGNMADTLDAYRALIGRRSDSAPNVLYERLETAASCGSAVIRVELLDQAKRPMTSARSFGAVTLRVWFTVDTPMPDGSVVICLKIPGAGTIAKLETHPERSRPLGRAGEHYIDCCIEHLPLLPGQYSIGAGLARHAVRMIDWGVADASLVVRDAGDPELAMSTSPDGHLVMAHHWET